VPELPDIAAYIAALEERIVGQPLQRVSIAKPFVLRTVEPPISEVAGRTVCGLQRIGKRIAIGFEGSYWIVLHLMIAGRLHWRSDGVRANRNTLAVLEFPNGSLALTEAGSKRRASIYVVTDDAALMEMDPGGIDALGADFEAFRQALARENRTLKRALTDPHTISGVGNAYSDEILHAAGLSPTALTGKLSDAEWQRLYDATHGTLRSWMERLIAEASINFPERVTAFRADMAAHGRYGKPCLVCGTKIHRIRYADNETNYCPQCQTGGKILADRALSRLLK
jgi:formamidopyrimidine-DNA glycosylase